jgi:type IV pilus assembly protein PilB
MAMRKRIGQLLLAEGALDRYQLESALGHQRRWGGRIGRAIIHLGFMKEKAVLSAVGRQLGVPFVELHDTVVPRDVLALIPERLIRERKVLPLSRLQESRRGPVVVAVPDPADLMVLDEIAFAIGLQIRPVLASEEDLDHAIARHLDGVVRSRGDFRSRPDAIDLPEDTNPLTVLRRSDGGWDSGTTH